MHFHHYYIQLNFFILHIKFISSCYKRNYSTCQKNFKNISNIFQSYPIYFLPKNISIPCNSFSQKYFFGPEKMSTVNIKILLSQLIVFPKNIFLAPKKMSTVVIKIFIIINKLKIFGQILIGVEFFQSFLIPSSLFFTSNNIFCRVQFILFMTNFRCTTKKIWCLRIFLFV